MFGPETLTERTMEFIAIPYIVVFGLVVWWAWAWGRSVFWAIIGSLLLSPIIWAIVLLILGRDDDAPK
ncbi:MAG: hypothetical protein ACQEUZ_15485 [Pseudomonadota bacterium]